MDKIKATEIFSLVATDYQLVVGNVFAGHIPNYDWRGQLLDRNGKEVCVGHIFGNSPEAAMRHLDAQLADKLQ